MVFVCMEEFKTTGIKVLFCFKTTNCFVMCYIVILLYLPSEPVRCIVCLYLHLLYTVKDK